MDRKEENRMYREACVQLLSIVWDKIDFAGMSIKRRIGIYEEFASKIKSSACTSKLERFLENLMRKFEVRAIKDNEKQLRMILNFQHYQILKIMREETAVLVLMLRAQNEKRNKERNLKKAMEGMKNETNS